VDFILIKKMGIYYNKKNIFLVKVFFSNQNDTIYNDFGISYHEPSIENKIIDKQLNYIYKLEDTIN